LLYFGEIQLNLSKNQKAVGIVRVKPNSLRIWFSR